MILFAIILVLSLAFYALMAIYVERKISAFIQDRFGPTETGKFGLLQSFADILKLLQKESIRVHQSDYFLFLLAPILIFISVFIGFAAIPFNQSTAFANLNLGIVYTVGIITIEVLGLLLAGWSSNNKYALFGSVRSVAQIISYEIPAILSIIAVVMITGSLNLQEISEYQRAATDHKFLGFIPTHQAGGFLHWNVFTAPHLIIAFFIYFIASLAECNRAPFDIPEAESELVAGFHTEYSGLKFGLIFLAEYAMMLLVSMIAVVLFLGSYHSPLPNIGNFVFNNWTSGPMWNASWIVLKALTLVAIQMWIRWTYPRLRVDQLMQLCWKVLIPLAFACILFSGVFKLLM